MASLRGEPGKRPPLPKAIAAAVNQKYGLTQTVNLAEEPLRIAGAIAQAGVENGRGTFNMQR